MYRLIFFLTLFGTFALYQLIIACRCVPRHPQEKFCNADFVALVTPIDKDGEGHVHVYTVKNITIFKMTDNAKFLLGNETMLIHTRSSSASCGIKMNLDREYIISGKVSNGKAWTGLCSYTAFWEDVTEYQREAIKSLYNTGCDCEFNTCLSETCVDKNNTATCALNDRSHLNCYYDFSYCGEECQLIRSSYLEHCLNK